MDEIQANELWREICFILANKSGSISEELYELKIILALEKMGWNQFREEIIQKQSIQFGSVGSIIPDILIKFSGKSLFVIEVKNPSVNVDGDRFQKQLFSYMRQLKLAYGLLIGSKIQIYYDGKLNKLENPILLNSLEIVASDKNGLDFIRLFSKESFSYENIEIYADNKIKEIDKGKKYNELIALLISPEYKQKIEELILEDLLEQWDEESLNKALRNIELVIKNKPEAAQINIPQSIQIPINSKKDVKYEFSPPDEREFKNQLLIKKFAYIKIFYKDGNPEVVTWRANNFSDSSNLRGNINSMPRFRSDNVQRRGVTKAIFSITPFQS